MLKRPCALAASLLLPLLLWNAAEAAKGDCGQPASSGSKPAASDALAVLKAAVGQTECALHVCDVDDNGKVTATDALRVLRVAVGQNVTLDCPAPADTVDLDCGSTGGTITLKTSFGEEVLDLSADLRMTCADPSSGGGDCECTLQRIDPIALTSFGVVCASPTDLCGGGSLDCNGGSPKQTQFLSDHDVGDCSGKASCDAACSDFCDENGKTMMTANCEGYCAGGASAGSACTLHADCPGSYCFGQAFNHGNICSCHCVGAGGSAAAAGHLSCRLGLRLTFELQAPCGDGDQLFLVADQCLTLTSESLAGVIEHANNGSGEIAAGPLAGASQSCSSLSANGTEGVSLVGAIPMTDTPTYGDIFATLNLPCD